MGIFSSCIQINHYSRGISANKHAYPIGSKCHQALYGATEVGWGFVVSVNLARNQEKVLALPMQKYP